MSYISIIWIQISIDFSTDPGLMSHEIIAHTQNKPLLKGKLRKMELLHQENKIHFHAGYYPPPNFLPSTITLFISSIRWLVAFLF
jgi:hypothetical protein